MTSEESAIFDSGDEAEFIVVMSNDLTVQAVLRNLLVNVNMVGMGSKTCPTERMRLGSRWKKEPEEVPMLTWPVRRSISSIIEDDRTGVVRQSYLKVCLKSFTSGTGSYRQ